MDDKIAAFNQRLREDLRRRDEPTGWCISDDLFEEILATFPDAPVTFAIQNFTESKYGSRIRRVAVSVEGLGAESCAYLNYPKLKTFFPELDAWKTERKDGIRAREFIHGATTIAALIKRQLRLVHLYGSRGQDGLSKNYGPFMPA